MKDDFRHHFRRTDVAAVAAAVDNSVQVVHTSIDFGRTWQSWIRWMQETQNLWQFDPATEAGILDYLAKNYPPQVNRRRAPVPPDLMPRPAAVNE